ncbi:MAG: 30S ribosomal protein S24e [Thermoplasmataceae archaeon]|jgi:small subunit ribosomal protein S24e
MKLNVIEVKENPLLKRKEIRYLIEFDNDTSPSRETIREVIARNYKADHSLVIVDKNLQITGSHSMEGYSKIYNNKEAAMLYEPDYELIRNKLKEKEVKN